jgi:hypothetical protein
MEKWPKKKQIKENMHNIRRVAVCGQRTNLADTSQLYRHTYGTTDKLKSMDNSNFNKKNLEYETVLQKSWHFLS